MRISILFVATLATLQLFGQTFSDVAPANGITRSYGFGELSGGVSFADFNGDGWDDLSFTSQDGDSLYFYVNTGGSFQQITPPVNNLEESKEIIWVDYDNDGDKDLYLTVYEGVNRLYRNNGGLVMEDVTLTAFGALVSEATLGAVWGDIDRDGWIDLYVTGFYYEAEIGETNRLYMNNGDGTFTNVSGQTVANDGVLPTFDGVFIDYNNDGWPDLYTTNDKYSNPNGLYRNDQGVFTDVTQTSGAGLAINSMNAGGADYDNDGDLDLYLSNTPQGNVLLGNNGDGTFTDVTAAAGVGFYRVGWASTFFDFDNDMDKDLYVSCMSDNIFNFPNALYINQGNGTFTEPLRNTGGLGGTDIGSSLSHAIGDIDNDGRLDIAMNQFLLSPFVIWHNEEPMTGNWVKVNLFGLMSNTEGVGSMIEIWAGGVHQIQYTHCSMGYMGQHSSNYHFGLGSNTVIDSLIIEWPSGIRDKMTNVNTINDVIYVTEGDFALPVTLLDFSLEAAGKDVRLDWTTAEEVDVSHFEIERSLNGRNFDYVGQVRAVGNSLVDNAYDFMDLAVPATSTLYYRLKMVDVDGSFEYSPLRSIQSDEAVGELFSVIRLPTNPVVDNRISIGVDSRVAGPIQLSLLSRNGSLIVQHNQNVELGENTLSLTTNKLPAGSYFLKVEMDGLTKSFQLFIK